jgi:hypothetical protein
VTAKIIPFFCRDLSFKLPTDDEFNESYRRIYVAVGREVETHLRKQYPGDEQELFCPIARRRYFEAMLWYIDTVRENVSDLYLNPDEPPT